MNKINDLYQNEVAEKQKLTMIELFSGIGAQKEGTDLTGIFDCEVVATADIEKDAMVSYAAIHDGLTNEMIDSYENYPSDEQMRSELIEKNIGFDFKKMSNPIARMKGRNLKKYYLAMIMSKNLGDISKISELPLADFWTYSFPCQDISVAGKQAGIVQGETRSGLLYEVERLLVKAKESDTLPKYLLLENVKNLVGKQFKEQFDDWITRLDELGFNTYWSVVNAKDCGIAQNRERVFAVSIGKDIDTKQFEFMKPFDLGLRLRDFLDDEVDEKYYISREKVEKLLNSSFVQERLRIQTTDVCSCLLARDYKDPKCVPVRIGNVYGEQFGTGYAGNVWSKDGVSTTLMTMQGCGRQPHIIEEKYGIDKSVKNTKIIDNANCITTREDRGVSNHQSEGTAVLEKIVCEQRTDEGIRFFKNDVVGTRGGGNTEPKVEQIRIKQATKKGYIECEVGGVADFSYPNSTTRRGRVQEGGTVSPTITATKTGACRIEKDLRVRKLTPKECWRLMGFSDECYDKALSVRLSDSAGYKQAGNSIVTYCIKGIMEHLYKAQYDNTYVCFDENFTKPQAD